MSTLRSVFLACCLMAATVYAFGQGIDPVLRGEDQRLEQPVSVYARRITVGELLRQLGQQSGVDMGIDDLDASSGYELFVRADRIPLGRVMDSLFGLFSSKDAMWKWIRSGKPGAYSYLLVESQPAREREARIRRLAEEALAEYMALMRDLVAMPPNERLRCKKRVMATLKCHDDLATTFLSTQVFWDDAKLFFAIVPREQQDALIGGQGVHKYSVDQLPVQARKQFITVFRNLDLQIGNHGDQLAPAPVPDRFALSRAPARPGEDLLAPSVWIDYPGIGSTTLLGSGLASACIGQKLRDAWVMDGDAIGSPLSLRKVSDKPLPDSSSETEYGANGKARLDMPAKEMWRLHTAHLAIGADIPILAIFKRSPPEASGPIGNSVNSFLDRIVLHSQAMAKWRDGVLLLNTTAWFATREPAVPYRWINLLRSGPQGDMTLSGLVDCVSRLDDQQTQWMSEAHSMRSLVQLRPLLVYASHHAPILTDTGCEVHIDDLLAFQALGYLYDNFPTNRPARLRLTLAYNAVKRQRDASIRLEIYDPESNKWSTYRDLELSTPTIFRYPDLLFQR